MMLGADAVAVSNTALQAIGCLGMRACNTNNCPVGIASMKDHLRAKLEIDKSAKQLYNYFRSTAELIQVIARACGHADANDFDFNDLSTYHREIHYLMGIPYAGLMKPGEGKPHRSCAARYIAGGIPPVFKVEQNGTVDYYLVKGAGGKAKYDELFSIIVERVSLEGQAYQVDDWKVIEIDDLSEIKRLSQGGLPNPPMCSF